MNTLEKIMVGVVAWGVLAVSCGTDAAEPGFYQPVALYGRHCEACEYTFLGPHEQHFDEEVIPGQREMSCLLLMDDLDRDGVPGRMVLSCLDPTFAEHQVEVTADNADRDDGDPTIQ